MMYKIPMPTRTNGVRIFKLPNEQVGIEYQRGEPHVGGMAYDSALGSMARDVTIRRPDIDKIIADAVRKVDAEDILPKAGNPRSMDMANQRNAKEYDSDEDTYADPQEVAAKVIAYLKDLISPDDLEAVNGLLMGNESDDAHEGRRQATDRRARRQAADQARRRPMTESTEDAYLRLFPNANRLA